MAKKLDETDETDEIVEITEEVDGPAQVEEVWHRVRPGETWQTLAETYETTVEALLVLSADNPQVLGPESIPVNARVRVR